jgi:hypothetical protein
MTLRSKNWKRYARPKKTGVVVKSILVSVE